MKERMKEEKKSVVWPKNKPLLYSSLLSYSVLKLIREYSRGLKEDKKSVLLCGLKRVFLWPENKFKKEEKIRVYS